MPPDPTGMLGHPHSLHKYKVSPTPRLLTSLIKTLWYLLIMEAHSELFICLLGSQEWRDIEGDRLMAYQFLQLLPSCLLQ